MVIHVERIYFVRQFISNRLGIEKSGKLVLNLKVLNID